MVTSLSIDGAFEEGLQGKFSLDLNTLLVDVLLQVDQVDQVVKALMQMQLMSLA